MFSTIGGTPITLGPNSCRPTHRPRNGASVGRFDLGNSEQGWNVLNRWIKLILLGRLWSTRSMFRAFFALRGNNTQLNKWSCYIYIYISRATYNTYDRERISIRAFDLEICDVEVSENVLFRKKKAWNLVYLEIKYIEREKWSYGMNSPQEVFRNFSKYILNKISKSPVENFRPETLFLSFEDTLFRAICYPGINR